MFLFQSHVVQDIIPQWTDTTDSFQETHENSDKEDEAPAWAHNTIHLP